MTGEVEAALRILEREGAEAGKAVEMMVRAAVLCEVPIGYIARLILRDPARSKAT